MGNHRFRLANMMPNAWFFKLRDMNKSKPNKPNTNSTRAHPRTHAHHNPSPAQITPSRASYYFPSNPKALDTHFPPQSPRKPRRKPTRPIFSTSSSSSRTSTSESDSSTISHCKMTSSADDIIFDVSELPPPIVTKKKKKKKNKEQQQQEIGGNAANSAARLRVPLASSPRLGVAMKVRAVQRAKVQQQQQQQRRSLWDSVAVVKSSSDPRRDFRESMREMIRENNLRASKDLEELLACYLSLNSDEYHGLIVRAFEEIWFDVSERV